MISDLLYRLRALFGRKSMQAALDEEFESHLRMAAEERMRQGEAAEQARVSAVREFGDVGLVKETTRDMWGWGWLEAFLQDIRFGLRQLRKHPAFTCVAVLTLALGVGANTAIFSLINTLMLRLLPVRDPESLVELLHQYPGEPRMNGYSWQSYEHFRDHNHVFSGLIGFCPSRFDLRGEGLGGQTVDGEYVVGDFFPVLGVKPAIGRLIGPGDDLVGAARSAVAVVSWSFWKSRFNLDPGILGKRIILQDVPVTVIGVAPREFFNQAMARYYFADANPIGKHFTIEKDWKNIGGPDKPYEIVGVAGDAKYDDAHEAPPRTLYLTAFGDGRMFANDFILRTSIPPDAVSSEARRSIAELLKGVEVRHIATMSEQVDASIVPERLIAMFSGSFGTLGLILAAIGLYGLLAYTAARRTKEIGVRMALGATRGAVTWMVLRDALAMVSAGLAGGIPVALWARKFASSLIEGLPSSSVLTISFAALGVIVVALLASYIPARRATKVDPMVALRYE